MPEKKKNFRIDWDFKKMFEGLDKYGEHVKESFHETGKLVAMDGLGRMVELAPVITGYLRGSGSVHVNGYFVMDGRALAKTGQGDPVTSSGGGKVKPKKDETKIVWGFNASYAAQRHELPKPGLKGGGGKFVENVLKLRTGFWMKTFAENLKGSNTGVAGNGK